jgi:hypothetical protein
MAIQAILDSLVPKLPVFQRLAEEGCHAELFVGWFFNKTNTGDVFDPALLARLGEFRLGLSLDIYAPLEGEQPEADSAQQDASTG